MHDRYERVHQAPQPAAPRDGPLEVLIAGGGPAALEAALTLHRLAGTHVTTTLLAPDTEFTYRPLSVLAPFAAGAVPGYPLARIAADAGFTHRRGALASVDASGHAVLTHDGERIGYDVLLVAAARWRCRCLGVTVHGVGRGRAVHASCRTSRRLHAPRRVRRARGSCRCRCTSSR